MAFGVGPGGTSWSVMRTLKEIDKWIANINANMNNCTKIGYKANLTSFSGGTTFSRINPSNPQDILQIPEQGLKYSSSMYWGQGEIVNSSSDTHLAVDGQGMFMYYDVQGNVYYSRDGECHRDEYGFLRNKDGMYLMDVAMAINTGLYNPGNPTVAEINADSTGWRKSTGSMWFPYVPGTKYNEGNGTYQHQTINIKKVFFNDNANATGTLTIRSDNRSYVVVNGHILTAADVIAGMNPPTDGSWLGQFTTYNITPYLRIGANVIGAQVTEVDGGEIVQISGDIDGKPITSDTTWAVEINPTYTGGSWITQADADRICSFKSSEIVLARFGDPSKELEFSPYGTTIWERTSTTYTPTISLPKQNGMGEIIDHALEKSNITSQQLINELASAEKLYTSLAKIVEACNIMKDALLNATQVK